MANLRTLEDLKERVEKAQREKDRAAGALSQAMLQLQERYGCDTLEEAEKLLKKLRKEEKAAEERFDDAFTKFKEKWGDEW